MKGLDQVLIGAMHYNEIDITSCSDQRPVSMIATMEVEAIFKTKRGVFTVKSQVPFSQDMEEIKKSVIKLVYG